jgi:hypothetical protein
VNERRNPTLCADNRFFSSSFHGFFPRDDSVASGSWGRLAKALKWLLPFPLFARQSFADCR